MPEAIDRLIALAGMERVGSYTRVTKTGKTVRVDAYTRDPGTMANAELFKAFKDLGGKTDPQSKNQHARVVKEIQKRQSEGKWGHSSPSAAARAQNKVSPDKGASDETKKRFAENRENPGAKFERLVKYETGERKSDGTPVREPVRDKEGNTVETPEYSEHIEKLTALIDSIYSDPAKLNKYDTQRKHGLWGKDSEGKDVMYAYTPERTEQHKRILEEILEKHASVPTEKKAVMSGGLGGAGKGFVLGKYAGIDESQYVVIDPDGMKTELLKRGMGPDIPGMLPMEQAAFIHEESSDLANMLQSIALSRGMNIILDTTMAAKKGTDDASSADKKIALFKDAGYDIRGIFVDVPVSVSVDSALDRHAGGVDRFNSGKEGGELGGRFVPPAYIQGAAPTEGQQGQGYNSKNRAVFERLKAEGKFSDSEVWDNSDRSREPQLVNRTGAETPKEASQTSSSAIQRLKDSQKKKKPGDVAALSRLRELLNEV